ncbi:magnesium chelatase subunit D [Glacieibacterium sp.]|uniref:magnesium chelatase subunit D n=1 Tax=Glacieibacterium sp. TaxID=2860237 RepID=UPI003B00DD82
MTPSVLALFAIDPIGLGGVVLRGPADLARERWLEHLAACLPTPPRRLPPGIDDARLIGGLDIAATLAAGRAVARGGLLAEADGGVVIVPMAERLDDRIAGQLAAALDTGTVRIERDGATLATAARFGLLLLDEGVGDDARIAEGLGERLAFAVEAADDLDSGFDPAGLMDAIAAARARLGGIAPPSTAVLEALCETAMVLGVASARAGVLALRAARAAAALAGRDAIGEADVAVAARLVLAIRATRLPEMEADGDAPKPRENNADNAGDSDEDRAPGADALTEIVLAAARAAIPANLLKAAGGRTRRQRGGSEGGRGSGERRASWRRGRPVGVLPGVPGNGRRLALAATLNAAAIWQRVRRAPGSSAIVIRRDDLRVRRFETRAETTVVVLVDASGSAAVARLAEAKGAVELLLGQAYVERTQVALIAFRGTGAVLALPPTRSLTRARNVLAELAGGGGTPLAAGLDAGLALALAVRARGRTPRVVLLTDGRGNVARDPAAGRAQATADADGAARALAAAGIAVLLIDTAPRPRAETRAFAAVMGARYLALPRLDAGAVAQAIRAA